jgi:tyrosine-specific transport protein
MTQSVQPAQPAQPAIKPSSTWQAALLVAGTAIGGGMLALPVMTGLGGFLPSLLIYVLCWAFMYCTGLLFLEISQWVGTHSNLVSIAEKTLGMGGKIAAWLLYLFLFYCLTLAYVVGCGEMVGSILPGLPAWGGAWIFTLLVAPFVFLGSRVVVKFNLLLMAGLGLSFLAFVILGAPYVQVELLKHADWSGAMIALPICFTSFAYQGIIPTLIDYVHHDIPRARRAILIGTLIPLAAYILWQWLILGIIPPFGPYGLVAAMEQGHNAVQPLSHFLDNPVVRTLGQAFAFFALLTSFFGVTLGLVDFLADGLALHKTRQNKLLICTAIFLPVLLIATYNPHLFLVALDLAGGFGCAALLGLLPILMVLAGRYRQGRKADYKFKGGVIPLLMLLLFVLFELGLSLYLQSRV